MEGALLLIIRFSLITKSIIYSTGRQCVVLECMYDEREEKTDWGERKTDEQMCVPMYELQWGGCPGHHRPWVFCHPIDYV